MISFTIVTIVSCCRTSQKTIDVSSEISKQATMDGVLAARVKGLPATKWPPPGFKFYGQILYRRVKMLLSILEEK